MSSEFAWDVLNSETIHTGFNYEVKEERVKLPSNRIIEDFEYLCEPNAVVVLAFTEGGDVVIVKEWRQIVDRLVEYGLPGGAIEKHESPEKAAKRELQEETGYEAGSLTQLIQTEPTNGFSDGLHTFFVADNCKKTGKPSNTERGEKTSVRTETFDTLITHIRDGTIKDSKTVIPVLYYMLINF